ncbi:hypothetical protein Ae717Ps2_0359 [Pseudonocardia sp. Ae717_Ps2]|nr:hypothetical protein Ae717Ps2_0359 [Pseudonocardia sp. Ae717_Ps2]
MGDDEMAHLCGTVPGASGRVADAETARSDREGARG